MFANRGKNWYLDFAFEEVVEIKDRKITEQVIIGVDLGLNNACVCSAMKSNGTVIDRQFLKLPREKDCLNSGVNRIKKEVKITSVESKRHSTNCGA